MLLSVCNFLSICKIFKLNETRHFWIRENFLYQHTCRGFRQQALSSSTPSCCFSFWSSTSKNRPESLLAVRGIFSLVVVFNVSSGTSFCLNVTSKRTFKLIDIQRILIQDNASMKSHSIAYVTCTSMVSCHLKLHDFITSIKKPSTKTITALLLKRKKKYYTFSIFVLRIPGTCK